jgi:hypothetical protein
LAARPWGFKSPLGHSFAISSKRVLRVVNIRHSADPRSLNLLFLGNLYIFIQLQEKEEWPSKSWGCSMEPFFDAGWIMNNSFLLKIHGGSPDKLNEILKSHAEVDSFTFSYSGFEDEFFKA